MHYPRLTAAILFGTASAAALAQAQSAGGMGDARAFEMPDVHGSSPHSTRDSNIVPADTRAAIAPELPMPPVGPDAGAGAYLQAARSAIAAGRTGEAQQSLEMAETRVLGGSIPAGDKAVPGDTQRVSKIQDALRALGEGDRQRAVRFIELALSD